MKGKGVVVDREKGQWNLESWIYTSVGRQGRLERRV